MPLLKLGERSKRARSKRVDSMNKRDWPALEKMWTLKKFQSESMPVMIRNRYVPRWAKKLWSACGHAETNFSAWERVNFGIAIELLSSPWLRMTWAHVDFVCTVSDEVDRNREPPESQPVPNLRELHAKLNDELASIRNSQLMRPKRNAS